MGIITVFSGLESSFSPSEVVEAFSFISMASFSGVSAFSWASSSNKGIVDSFKFNLDPARDVDLVSAILIHFQL